MEETTPEVETSEIVPIETEGASTTTTEETA